MIDLSPDEFRRLAYQAVEIIATQLEQVRTAPTRQAVPAELRQNLMGQSLPLSETNPNDLLQRFTEEILPYPMGNSSPRFMAWVNSTPAPLGIIADFLASALDPSVAGGDHAATYVEHAVLKWTKEIVNYPLSSGGLLVSGGSVANLVCLGAMRHAKTDSQDRKQGLTQHPQPMTIYASTEGHSCIQKAIEVLGFGSDYFRKIPVDANCRMDMQALEAQIQKDRAAGLQPVCVVASAGTVNTGAIDPFKEIADLCERENLWFHIDGSYGAVGILAEQTQGLYEGMERADSLALDHHKWMYMPIECGCALVKDAAMMRDTYSLVPSYLRDDRNLPWFSEFGIQQTRGFRALKLWMVIQQIGINGYRQLISHDIEMARKLAEKIEAHADFELVALGDLSAICFRYTPAGVEDLDTLNRTLIPQLMNGGKAAVSGTDLNGRPVLRGAFVNFRTQESDLDAILEAVIEAGKAVLVRG